MHLSISRLAAVFVVWLLLLSGLGPAARAANWYVNASAAGPAQDGMSPATAWTSFAAITQSGLSAGDTVFVHSGTYNELFTISKSGTSTSSRITYKGVDTGGGKPVLRGIEGGTFDFIGVIGIEFSHLSAANNYAAITLRGGDGWLIQDNYIHNTYGSGIDARFNTVNNNNVIRHNLFDDICSIAGGVGSGIVVTVHGDGNLVEYNSITKSLDRFRAFGARNIIRNNFMGATDTAPYPNSVPFPFHTDAFQSFESSRDLTQFLYERNYDADNMDSIGGTNAHGITIQSQLAAGLFNWAIFRFNVLVRPGGPAFIIYNFNRLYGYNMTSIAVQNGAPNLFRSAVVYDPGAIISDLHDWRNNTWSFSPRIIDASGVISTANRPTNFTSNYQHSFNTSGTQPILPSSAPNNLPNINPLFSNVAADDYTLQSASPLRNAGGPITTASGSGSNSTSLMVADSKRLFDGWGVADADFIKIGSGSYVQVASIDYTTNVVTLTAARTWTSGAGVTVKGAEDIGALPYSYAVPIVLTNTTPITLAAGPVNLTASVGNPDAVRMVEFLVDGLPVGIDYTSPYSVAWTADGAPHDVEARAYNAWASQTLTKRKFNTGPIFTSHPASQQVSTGTTVILSAAASAPNAPTFQWQKNGVNVANGGKFSGATTNTLTITSVTTAEAGTYTLVATNSVATDTSDNAVLLVDAVPPSFTTQPPPTQTVLAGATATFTVVASGTPTPTLQWKKNGIDLSNGGNVSGATSATLTLTSVGASDAATYTVVADNTINPPATSNNAVLVVTGFPPTISVPPASQTVGLGATASFSVTASGTAPLAYQWLKGGVDILLATGSSYSIASAQAGDAGSYSVRVTNAFGSVTSAAATLVVDALPPAPAITIQPVATPVVSGRNVSFLVAASGSTAYQWQVSTNGGTTWTQVANDSTYSGATTATLTIRNAPASLNGQLYRAVALNAGGSTASNSFSLTVLAPVLVSPVDVVTSSDGRLLVTDSGTNVIQSITSDGVAIVLAGVEGVAGSSSFATLSLFRSPAGLALDTAGNLYVSDSGNSLIRKIAPSILVTTVAGSDSNQAHRDGVGTAAWFNLPLGVAVDSTGNLFVADTANSVIRKITPDGTVTTLAGTPGARGSANGTGSAARFNDPSGIAVDASGNLYVADALNQTIRKITSAGVVTTLAGVPGIVGTDDGTGSGALFNHPRGITVDPTGNLYVSDSGNSTIRRVTAAGAVTTFAGLPTVSGLEDGTGFNALFNQPVGLRLDATGNLYVVDNGNATIRRVTPAGAVTTLAIRRAPPGQSIPSTPTPPATPTPPPVAPPASLPSGGGGGGAPSWWFAVALLAVTTARYRKTLLSFLHRG
jgi:sugar lactone lactonase YvrE